MKLAVPELRRKLMDPRSDVGVLSESIFGADSVSFQGLTVLGDDSVLSCLAANPFDWSLENLHSIFLCRQVLHGLFPSQPSFIAVH